MPMIIEDKKILQEIRQSKNLTLSSIKNYECAMRQYTTYNQMSMTELLKEAEKEEEDGVRWKHRQIRRRLIGFRAYLLQKYEYKATTKTYLARILTIYRYYEIELQALPSVSTRNKPNTQIRYEDLPTRDIIRRAVNNTDSQMRAIILFMSSSGTARTETTNLRVQDFINATREYHNSKTINEVLEELDPNRDIVPCWKIHRQKTGKDYYTFSTPESTRALIDYLCGCERSLTNDSSLFGIGHLYLTQKFIHLNDRLGLGKVGHNRRFRPHMLRKFHASQLSQGENALPVHLVDSLQGRGKNKVHRAYFLDNPLDMKRKYVLNMHRLFILEEKRDTTNEFAELQRRYDELKQDIQKEARNEVRKILLELGYEL